MYNQGTPLIVFKVSSDRSCVCQDKYIAGGSSRAVEAVQKIKL